MILRMKRRVMVENGELMLGGVPASRLAAQYGTPLYVMDETLIRQNMRAFRDSMKEFYGDGLVCYASKAFCCKEIYRIAEQEELGVDVVSLGELYTAKSVDFPMEKVCFHGNNKSEEELRAALEYGIGRIVADNLPELAQLDRIAAEMGKKAPVLLRIKPGIDAHTHSFIMTGQIDSKFGFALETGEAMEAAKQAIASPNLRLLGIHCHIGSQIFQVKPFVEAAKVMVGFMGDVKAETGFEMTNLNLGGGFGIRYTDEDEPVPFGNYMGPVSEAVRKTPGSTIRRFLS